MVAATAILLVTAVAAILKVSGDDGIAWLGGPGPAEWIVYPSPGDPGPRPVAELDAVFVRSLRLDASPSTADLRFRGFRRVAIWINGRPVAMATERGWKSVHRADVAGLLVAGENQVVAQVFNDRGPPALWLTLRLQGADLVTDGQWEVSWAGGSPRNAVPATGRMRGRRYDVADRTMSAMAGLGQQWRLVALFAIVSAALAAVVEWLGRRAAARSTWATPSPWPLRAAIAAFGLLWIALFVNNSSSIPLSTGFDASHHLKYVDWILDRHALPLANDGWQMFQPPLYYLALATAFTIGGLTTHAASAAFVVRAFGLAIGLGHLLVVAASMRALFPGRPRPQVLGLLVGAFLPCMLYLHQYPANEPLAAALSSAAVLVAVRLSRRAGSALGEWALLGLLLGLALLAKFSTLVVLVALLGALSAQTLLGDRARLRHRASGLATAALVATVTCGWHFARVWMRLGAPLVGGWDPDRGMGWWQDPGYRTMEDFVRFGRAMKAPVFAGYDGFWDGLYVTLWGDGLLSGLGYVTAMLPWWSLSLMSATCLLSLIPASAVVVGSGTTLLEWLRRPRTAEGMLLLLAFLTLVAIGFISSAVPSVVADKASYGLMALVPFAAFSALSLDRLMSGRPWLRTLTAAGLGAWALSSYATYWIDVGSAEGRIQAVPAMMNAGNTLDAARLLHDIARDNPDHWASHLMLAEIMLDHDAPRPEIVRLLEARASWPVVWKRHLLLSRLEERDGNLETALAEANRAAALAPDDVDAHVRVAEVLTKSGAEGEAVNAWRRVLEADARHVVAHRAVASLYERRGEVERAVLHRSYAKRLARSIAQLPGP